MKKTALTIALLLMGLLTMTATVSAVTVFDAAPENTTLANNGIGPQGTLSGEPGDLEFQNNGSGFNFSAFFSTDDINTLNGTPITAADTVTTRVTVSGLSVGVLRANGIDYGLQDPDVALEENLTSISNLQSGDLIVRAEASNSGGDIGTFFDGGDFVDSLAGATTGDITDGFTITLVADVDGYTFTLDSVGGTPSVEVSGAFTGTQFVDIVGNSRFFYAQQQFNPGNDGVNLLANITEASISVEELPDILAGDFNDDGVVDAADYVLFRDGGSPNANDLADFQVFLDNFGNTAASPAVSTVAVVPEPSAVGLLIAGLVAFGVRRAGTGR